MQIVRSLFLLVIPASYMMISFINNGFSMEADWTILFDMLSYLMVVNVRDTRTLILLRFSSCKSFVDRLREGIVGAFCKRILCMMRAPNDYVVKYLIIDLFLHKISSLV